WRWCPPPAALRCLPMPIPRRPRTCGRYRRQRACAAWSSPSVWSSGLSGSCRKSRRRDVRAPKRSTYVLASPILYARRLDIFERTAALRLPAMYQSPEFAEEGGLIGYGPRITLMFRQLARQLAKVFLPARTCCTWLCARAQFCSCPAMGGRKRRAAIRACQVRWRFLIRRYVGLFLALLGPLVFLSGFWGFL